jgi:hypothetical protein
VSEDEPNRRKPPFIQTILSRNRETGGPNAGTDSSDAGQRFQMRQLTESPDGQTTMIDLLMRSVGDGLRSKDARRRRSAERTALAMERANQRDEENLKIKHALVEQKGGHVDDSIPTGVILLERPSPTGRLSRPELKLNRRRKQKRPDRD